MKLVIKVSWDATLCILYTSGLRCPWLAFCLFILQFYHRIAHGYTLHYEVSPIGIHYQFLGKLLSAGCWTVCFQVSSLPLTGGQVALQRTHPFRLGNKSGGCPCDNLPTAPPTAYSRCQARSPCPHPLSSHTQSPSSQSAIRSQKHKKSLSSTPAVVGWPVSQQHNRPIFPGKWKCEFSSPQPSRLPTVQIHVHVSITTQTCPGPSAPVSILPANNHDYNYRKAPHCRVSLLMRWMGIGLACLLKEEHPLLYGAGNMEEALRFANVGPPFLEQKAEAVQKRWLCRVGRCHQGWDREKCWLTDLIFPIHRARSPEDKPLPIYYQTTLKSEKRNKIRLF